MRTIQARSRLRLLLLVAAAGVVSSAWAPVEPAHAGFYCPPVEQLYAAGSGGGQAPNLALRNELQRGLGDDLFWSRFVNYPAVSVLGVSGVGAFLRAGDVGSYHDSVVRGKNEMRRLVNQLIRNCGDRTRIVMSGYSQGAQVAADVYQELERSNRARYVFALILFGDPYFNGDPAGRGASTGDRRHAAGVDGGLGRRPGYSDYPNRVRSYCHRRDPICQANRSAAAWMGPRGWIGYVLGRLASGQLALSDHQYDVMNGRHLGEAEDAGRWISTRVRAQLPRPVQPPAPGTPPENVQPPDSSGANPAAPGGVPPGSYPETAGGVTHTWTNYTNAGGTQGPSVQAGQTIGIACKLHGFKVANGNTWWYKIASSPWNGAYYASADAFYNNGATSGSLVGTPYVDPNVPDCAGAPAPPPPPTPAPTWNEQQGSLGANTFTNPYNASGMGVKIPAYAWVQVSCKVYAPAIASANPDGYWYRIASAPWNNAYYAVANTFWNGDIPGVKPYTHNTDWAVPNC